MLQKLQKRKESGFTIIEVLIVLAIAGLILLIVFLAVPALQRNARNTGRKGDVGRISTGVNDFVSNNNGNLPANVGDLATVLTDAGTLSQLTGLNTSVAAVKADGSGSVASTFYLEANVTYAATAKNALNNVVILDTAQQCGNTQGATAVGTARQAAMLYTLETGNNGYQWSCLSVQ